MTNKIKALLVEDSPTYRDHISGILSERFEYSFCTSIEEANNKIIESDYDLFILDLYLPDGNTIELCQQLRNKYKEHDTLIVFLSSEKEIEWRLRAYSAGADDFIDKNINDSELLAKFETLIRYQSRCHEIIEKSKHSIEHITESLTQNNQENAQLLALSRQCLNTNSNEQLGELVDTFLTDMGLRYCLQINHGDVFQLKSDESDFSPIETELFIYLKKQGANIQTFGSNTYFLSGNIELIIQNMPINDELQFGSLKDILHMAMSNISDKSKQIARIKSIADECELIEHHIKENELDYALSRLDILKSHLEDDSNLILKEKVQEDVVFF